MGTPSKTADASAGTEAQETPARRARFARVKDGAQTHEERGRGWTARWREGAERIVIERLDVGKSKTRRRPVV